MKRVLAIALVLCMVMAWIPATASAESTHTHCACAHAFTGLDADKCASHNDSQVWTAWDENENANYKTTLPTTTGYYYLTEDVTLSAQQVISANVHICTNGFDIISTKTADSNTVIRQFKSGSLTITNCKAQIKDGRLDTSDPTKTSTLSGGNTNSANGGMLRADDTLPFNLYGVEFKDNQCTGSNASGWTAGAILAVKRNNVDIAYCAFTNNKSTVNSGGAISLRGSVANIRNTTFTGNYATTNGGAIFIVTDTNTPDVTLTDCTFTGNGVNGETVTTTNGGAIYANDGSLKCSNVNFSGNKVVTAGGAVYVNNGSVEAKNGTSFATNESVGSGGAVYVSNGSFEATGVTFTGNKTTGTTNTTAGGAALYMNAGTVTLTTVTMTQNENNGLHGSAITQNNGDLTLSSCSITGNINKSNQNRAGIVVINNGGSTTVTGNTVVTGNLNNNLEQNIFLRDTGSAETPKQPKLTVGALSSGANISMYTLEDLEPSAYLTATAQTPTFVGNDGYLTYENRLDEADKTYGIAYNGTAFSYDVVGHYHADCACAISGVTCKDHTSADAEKVFWTAWDEEASANYKTTLPTSGYYYLTDNVTISGNMTLGTNSVPADVHICTNGFDISYNYDANAAVSEPIRLFNGTFAITNCKAQLKNGKLDTSDPAKTSTISGGKTTASSAGFFRLDTGSLNLYGVEFKNNETSSNNETWTGGVVMTTNANSNLNVAYCAFNENRSLNKRAGAIGLQAGTADIRNTTFKGNTSATDGSIMLISGATATIVDSTVEENTSGSSGAIYLRAAGKAYLTNVTMTANQNNGTNGSAITAEGGTTVTLNSCNITGNTNKDKDVRAAIVTIDAATVTVTGNTVVTGNMNGTVERNLFLRTWQGTPVLTVGQLSEGANISVATSAAESDPDTFLVKSFTGDYQQGWISYSDGSLVDYNTTDGFFFVGTITEDGITYKPWAGETALPASGSYYLLEDVALNEALSLENAELKLHLNGNTVSAETVAALGEGAVLAIVSDGGSLSGKLKLTADGATVNADCAISLEMNGNDATVNASNVTLTDSATDNGAVGGKIYGNCSVASRVTQNGVIRYVILDGNDANGDYVTANAVRVRVSRINVRPNAAGIYYNTEVKFNQNVADQGATYGVALSVVNKPQDDFATDSDTLWTSFTAATGADFSSTGTSCLVTNIMKEGEDNTTRGAKDIHANAYVKLTVGGQEITIMMENAEVVYSLKKVMQALDTAYASELQAYAAGTGALSSNTEKAVNFYGTWNTDMSGWNLTNMAAAYAKKNAA